MKSYSIKEIEQALAGGAEVQELKETIDRQWKEIKALEQTIVELEKAIQVNDSINLAREFEANPQSFLDRPFKEYINSHYMRMRFFQEWFVELVSNAEIKTFSDLLNMPDADLKRFNGIGTAKINAIRGFGKVMTQGGEGIRSVRQFTGSHGRVKHWYR